VKKYFFRQTRIENIKIRFIARKNYFRNR